MARLHTSGFESQIVSTTVYYDGESDAAGVGANSGGTPTVDTTNQRSGAACLACAQGGTNYDEVTGAITTLGRAYFIRSYVKFSDASPASAAHVIQVRANAIVVGSARIQTSGKVGLFDTAGQLGSSSAVTLADNTWYRLELKVIIPSAGAGTLELYLDGDQVATSTSAAVNNTIATAGIRIGNASAGTAGITTYIDDVAVNDDQGASQNDYPGAGKVVLLKPVSVNTRNTWVGPQTTGDDTTNLEQNVDNTPPTGTSLAAGYDVDANAGKFVHNITAAANVNFDVNVQDYTAAGIGASDGISVAQALARMSVDSVTGTNTAAVQGVSNPAITAVTARNLEQTAVAGAEPTGWKTFKTGPVYDQSVTKGTSPVVRAQKEVSSTRVTAIDLMGLLVEYRSPVAVDGPALDLVWDLETTAAATPVDGPVLDLKWDLTSLVNTGVWQLKWDLRTEVESPVTDLLWDLRTEVNGAVTELIWDLQAPAATPVDGAVLDLIWDTRSQATGAVTELIWDTRSEANGAVTELIWDLRTEVNGGVLDLIADLRGAVASPVTELIWDMRSQVDGAVLDLIADLRTSVNGNVTDLIWDLRTEANGAVTELIWDLRNPVDGNVTDLKWDVVAQVASPVTELIWDMQGQVASPVLDLVWDLVTTGLVNGVPLDLVWDTRATVNGDPLDLIADLRTQVNGSVLDLISDVRAQADGIVLDLLWDVRTTADGNVTDLKWDLAAAVAAQRTLLWDLRAETSALVLELVWDLVTFGAVNAAPLALVSDLRVETSRSVAVVWDLRAQTLSDVLALVWDVSAGGPINYVDYTSPLSLDVEPVVCSLAVDARGYSLEVVELPRSLVVSSLERSLAVDEGVPRFMDVNQSLRSLVVHGPTYVEYEGELYLAVDAVVNSLELDLKLRGLAVDVLMHWLDVGSSDRALIVGSRELQLAVDDLAAGLTVNEAASRLLEVLS